MAEFMGHHPLEFVPVELLQASPGHGHHGVFVSVTRGKSVDACLIVQHVDHGHGHARGDGDLLHHVDQHSFFGVGGSRIDPPAAQAFSHI